MEKENKIKMKKDNAYVDILIQIFHLDLLKFDEGVLNPTLLKVYHAPLLSL